jgi:hypothetical protein
VRAQIGNTLFQDFPFIFPNNLVHGEVALAANAVLVKHGFKQPEPVSAGSYCALDGSCSGGSESLGLTSRPVTDEQLIQLNDYGVGVF